MTIADLGLRIDKAVVSLIRNPQSQIRNRLVPRVRPAESERAKMPRKRHEISWHVVRSSYSGREVLSF